jgi:hypothetical protein
MHFHIGKMYKDKEVQNVKNFFVNVWRKNIFDIYVTEYGTALTTIIIATGPCIANQLRDVNTICRRIWYIAAHVWKIYDFKIEVVPLIINFSTEYILQSWKLKRPPIQLRPHHFWTYTSNLTTVVNSVLKFMISETTSIFRDGIYFDKILISKYKLFKRSNKANLFIALVQ